MTLHALVLAALPALFLQIEAQPARDDADQAAQEAPKAPVLTKAPELKHYEDPVYPEAAKADGVQGDVVVLLTLDATGAVTDATVAESADPRLNEAALAAARKLTFTPAEVDGKPAPIQLQFRFGFTLEAPPPPAEEETAEAAPLPDTLKGRVLQRGNRSPVAGAWVVSGDAAAQTDADGRFALKLPVGEHPVEVKATGYHPFATWETVSEGEATEVTYYLLRKSGSPFEEVVRAPRPKKEVTRVTLSREEASKVPGTFGDPLRVIENLPGMARSPFIGGQLLVRGSSPGDSGVYFEGVEIPLLYHFGGLTSVINPEFLDEIDFLPGGFGASHGRATGGIVDVTSRNLAGKLARGSAKADLMDASFFWRQPLGEHAAVAVAARRSYVDTLLPPFLSAAGLGGGVTLAPVYADYQAKADWEPTDDHRLSLFVFGSDDTFAVATPLGQRQRALGFDLRLGFHRLLAAWRWQITKDLTLTTRPWIGLTIQSFGGGEVSGPLQANASLTNYEAGHREELVWTATDRFTLRAGLDLYTLRGKANIDAPISFDLISFPSPMQDLPSEEQIDFTSGGSGLAAWVEATYEPVDGLQLTPGLRQETYVFATSWHPTLDPRLAVRWKVGEHTTLKGAAGLYHQPPSIFQVNELSGTPTLRPEAASQLVLGVEQDLTDVIDLDVEGFVNQRWDLAVGNRSNGVEGGEYSGDVYVNNGKGRAFGAEVLLRHKLTERLFGWISYTLMKSEERSWPGDAFIPTDYDQTHILTMVASWRVGGGFEVGGRFRLVTGNPYTPVLYAVHDLDTDGWRTVRGDPNSARMPTFNQLDVRVDYTKVFDTWTFTAFVDLLNAYNQPNVENFQYDYRYREQVPFTGLPIFPVLGMKGEW